MMDGMRKNYLLHDNYFFIILILYIIQRNEECRIKILVFYKFYVKLKNFIYFSITAKSFRQVIV